MVSRLIICFRQSIYLIMQFSVRLAQKKSISYQNQTLTGIPHTAACADFKRYSIMKYLSISLFLIVC